MELLWIKTHEIFPWDFPLKHGPGPAEASAGFVDPDFQPAPGVRGLGSWRLEPGAIIEWP